MNNSERIALHMAQIAGYALCYGTEIVNHDCMIMKAKVFKDLYGVSKWAWIKAVLRYGDPCQASTEIREMINKSLYYKMRRS